MVRPYHFTVNNETAADNRFQISNDDAGDLSPLAYAEITRAAALLQEQGITVHLFEGEDSDVPDSVFPNNWFSTHAGGYVAIYPMKGDDLVFHDVRFPLAAGVAQKDIALQVNAIPGMSQENAKFWNWLEEKPVGKGRQGGALSLDITMDNGSRVLGNVEMKGRFLHVATNSAERAQKGAALIRQALGDLVRTPLTEIRTVEQMMADPPARIQAGATSDIPAEVAEQVVHQFLDRQYRDTLDQPVGMLGNKTPRQAATSAAGRQKVAEWLKYLENQSSRQPDRANPMATYSFEWMWHELGVFDLRQ
ncbi:arginine deiminase-related protein [Mesorhizobium shangrilense]|uniref:Arginine deiminase-related protein n=1 Tax=Mesorhizobium shangrilense TaxID=460060 RepID=A0ABV2DS14_9HYPH